MKKLTNYIFAALLLLMTAGLQARVVEVCAGDGTDSETLSLTNYQYGNIQWQYSDDTLTWTDVQGAHDTVFRCLPERECYYRARIEYPNCPVDTTQVTHILFTPTANAGPGSTTSCGVASVRANETGSNGSISAVRDHQNNSYAVVQIGNQCWLKENMRCTTSPTTGANMVQNPASGASSTVRRAYYYDNNPTNAANGYGLLYNWPAAMDGSTTAGTRGICPEGWHLPTDAEWTAMMNAAVAEHQPGVTPNPAFSTAGEFGGDENTAISAMLSGGTDWLTDDGHAGPGAYGHALRNTTGFSAVPAGVYAGSFGYRGQYVSYWSSSAYGGSTAWYRGLYYVSAGVDRDYVLKEIAISVRCLRN